MSWSEAAHTKFINLGVKKGGNLYVSASFGENMQLIPRVNDIIDVLLNILGNDGTMIMPAYNQKMPLWQVYFVRKEYIFDKDKTQPNTGVMPSLFMRRDGVVRSSHPTNSLLCLGKNADKIVDSFGVGSGAYDIFSWLAEHDGQILYLGTGDELPALRHEIQARKGLLNMVPSWQGIRYFDNDMVRLFIREDVGGCVTQTGRMIASLRKENKIEESELLEMDLHLLDAKSTIEILDIDIDNNLSSYICLDPCCSWCRYVEKKVRVKADMLGKGYTVPSNFVLYVVFYMLHGLFLRSVPGVRYLLRSFVSVMRGLNQIK